MKDRPSSLALLFTVNKDSSLCPEAPNCARQLEIGPDLAKETISASFEGLFDALHFGSELRNLGDGLTFVMYAKLRQKLPDMPDASRLIAERVSCPQEEVIIECVLEFRIEAADTFIQRSAPERGWLGNHEICVQADIEIERNFRLGNLASLGIRKNVISVQKLEPGICLKLPFCQGERSGFVPVIGVDPA